MSDEPLYRGILGIDIQGFNRGEWTDPVRRELRQRLHALVDAALARAGITGVQAIRNDVGDGLWLIVGGVPVSRLLHPVATSLATGIDEDNRRVPAGQRMRLRVVVHAGHVLRDPHGYAGASVNHAARLLDADVIRGILAATPAASMVLVASDELYQGIVQQGYGGIDAGAWRRVRVQAKETRANAWVHLPGQASQPALLPAGPGPAAPIALSRQPGPTERDAGREAVLAPILGVLAAALSYLRGAPLQVAVALAVAAVAVSFAWRHARARRARGDGLVLTEVADQLAIAVGAQWSSEAQLRWLHEPHPLPVAWSAAEPDLVEPWSDLMTTASSWPGRRLEHPERLRESRPAPALAGTDDADLADALLDQVPTHRLVVLGEPGAGKTMLLVRLVLELLARRAPGGPVPVLVPLASWNPAERDLRTWLAARLTTDHPGLRLPAPPEVGGASRATALLDLGLLLPVLDGLDEIPESARGQAIAGINAALRPGQGLVLSCRVSDYRLAVNPRTVAPVRLRAAAGVVLHHLDVAAIRDYLRRDAGSPASAARWDPVLDALGTAAPVARALRTPLMVALARIVYNPRPGERHPSRPDPGELCDLTRFRTHVDVEEHLYDAFVPAAYRPAVPDPAGAPRWPAADAERWLRFLAGHLEHRLNGTTDLAWWELHRSAPRLLTRVAVGVPSGLACGLAAGMGNDIGVGIGVGLGLGTGLGLLVGGLARARIRAARGPLWGLAGGLAGGLVGGLVAGVAGRFGVGQAVGLAGGIPAGTGVGLAVGPALGLSGGMAGGLAGGLAAGLTAGLYPGRPAGVVNGLGIGLAAAVTIGTLSRPAPAHGLRWSPVGIISGLAVGLAVGLAAAVVAGPGAGLVTGLVVATVVSLATGLSSAPADLTAAAAPREVVARDRRAFRTAGLVFALAGFVAAGLITGLADAFEHGRAVRLSSPPSSGLAVGVAVGVSSGLTFAVLYAAWAPFALARCWLALRGSLPWRLMDFLADAHERRGVLRQVGATYQFRHAGLQCRLAAVQPGDADPPGGGLPGPHRVADDEGDPATKAATAGWPDSPRARRAQHQRVGSTHRAPPRRRRRPR